MSDPATSDWWEPQRPADVAPLLWHRRWWWHDRPFPHVRAVNVFRPAILEELDQAFGSWLDNSHGGGALPGHDLQGTTLTPAFEGPLRLFASRGWHRLLATVFDTNVTEHMNVGLHHHEAGSLPGFVHNDLNPGWFPGEQPGASGGIVLAEPGTVEYTTGQTSDATTETVGVVRAIAVLFYLANPVWAPAHRGETGLYAARTGNMDDAAVSVPPHSNSLLAFECTPWSFHGFQGGGTVPRNSVVGWLHRPRDAAVARWGARSIIGYGGVAT